MITRLLDLAEIPYLDGSRSRMVSCFVGHSATCCPAAWKQVVGQLFIGLPSDDPLRGSLFGFAGRGIGGIKAYRRKPKESLLRDPYDPSRILGRIWRTALEKGLSFSAT